MVGERVIEPFSGVSRPTLAGLGSFVRGIGLPLESGFLGELLQQTALGVQARAEPIMFAPEPLKGPGGRAAVIAEPRAQAVGPAVLLDGVEGQFLNLLKEGCIHLAEAESFLLHVLAGRDAWKSVLSFDEGGQLFKGAKSLCVRKHEIGPPRLLNDDFFRPRRAVYRELLPGGRGADPHPSVLTFDDREVSAGGLEPDIVAALLIVDDNILAVITVIAKSEKRTIGVPLGYNSTKVPARNLLTSTTAICHVSDPGLTSVDVVMDV